jgi:hypothetical protein
MSTAPGLAILALVGVFALIAGGEARAAERCGWRKGETLTLAGVVSQGGLSGPFTRRVELGSGRSTEITDFGAYTTRHGYDGRLAWSSDPSGASHDLDSGFARALAISESWIAARQGCDLRSGASAERQAPTIESGKAYEVWRITPDHGAPFEVWYDPATSLPDREMMQYTESRIIHRLADWRDVGGGRMVAFRQVDEDPEDEDSTTFQVQRATLAAHAAPSAFRRPPQPHDVRMTGRRRSTTVPYADDHRTRIFVPVYLNGKGPFTFEIDAGGHFILSPDTVKALGLAPQGALNHTGAGVDIAKAGFSRVGQVRIGEAQISGLVAKVLPLSAKSNDRGAQPPRAGILGLELFERFTVSFDRRAGTMTLTPRGEAYPKPKGTPLPLVFAEDAALTPGAFEGRGGDFMLDTGNAGPTIIEQFWAEQTGLAPALAAALPVADGVTLATGEVRIGPFRLPGEVVSDYGPAERGSEHTRAVAGVLGEPLLSRFDATYDYARKTVWFSPVAGLGPLPYNRAGLSLAKGDDGAFAVARVLKASPAAEAGLFEREIVDAVDGKPIAGWSRTDAEWAFKQPVGTVVQLTVRTGPSAPAAAVQVRLRELAPALSSSTDSPSGTATSRWRP